MKNNKIRKTRTTEEIMKKKKEKTINKKIMKIIKNKNIINKTKKQ